MIPAIAAALEAMGSEAATASTAMAASNKALAESADKSSRALNSMAEKLDDIQGRVSGLVGKLTGMSAEFTGTLTTAATALKSFADPIAELVALANPAVVEQFTLAFRDTLAVVGRALIPVMGSLTRGMRIVGDTFARLEPILNSVASVIADTLDGVFRELNNVWQENGAVLQVMAVVFETLVQAAGLAAQVVLKLAGGLLSLVNPILKLLGFGGLDKKPGEASSFGAAVRQIHTTSGGEEISRNAIEKALAASATAPKQDVPDLLGELNKKVATVLEFLAKVPTAKDVEDFLKNIFDHLPELPKIPGAGGAAGAVAGAGAGQIGRALISGMLGR